MSDDRINGSNRLEKAVGEEMYREIQLSKILDPSSVENIVVHTDELGNITVNTEQTYIKKSGQTVTKLGSIWQ